MSVELIVPTLGESITEATVSKWYKKIGEFIEVDEPLVEIETDKITVEVPSPSTGVLSEIKVKEGTDINIGGVLGIIDNITEDKKNSKNKKEEIQINVKENTENKLSIKKEKKVNLKEIKNDLFKLSPSVKKML